MTMAGQGSSLESFVVSVPAIAERLVIYESVYIGICPIAFLVVNSSLSHCTIEWVTPAMFALRLSIAYLVRKVCSA